MDLTENSVYLPLNSQVNFVLTERGGQSSILSVHEVYQKSRAFPLESGQVGFWTVDTGLVTVHQSIWKRRNNLQGVHLLVTALEVKQSYDKCWILRLHIHRIFHSLTFKTTVTWPDSQGTYGKLFSASLDSNTLLFPALTAVGDPRQRMDPSMAWLECWNGKRWTCLSPPCLHHWNDPKLLILPMCSSAARKFRSKCYYVKMLRKWYTFIAEAIKEQTAHSCCITISE